MEQILGSLPQLADLVQKGGVVGLLLIVCAVLAWEVTRLRKQQTLVFGERDAYRLAYALYKAECDRNNLKVDTAALAALPAFAPVLPAA